MLYAGVIVDISSEKLNRSFSYIVPDGLAEDICIGSRVTVPFGKGERSVEGYVVELSSSCDIPDEELKEIKEIRTDRSTVEQRLVDLAAWMSRYYSCNFIQALKTVLPVKKKIRAKKQGPAHEENLEEGSLSGYELTDDQKNVLCDIKNEWKDKDRPVLMFGVTGSGKTLIYMELIKDVISQGRQAIVLIPEIGLTFQNVKRFRECFGSRVSFLHSRLSAGEKYRESQKAKNGEVDIMIGPRSALFTPFSNLGLIIVDEEHENSYRSESAPRYHCVETAIKRGELEGAHVVMGSATPSVITYSKALSGEYALTKITKRYSDPANCLPGEGGSTRMIVVDMKEELRRGNRSPLSRALTDALDECLENKNQAMLFLNRRGYTGFIKCRSCGHVIKCPHCDVSLTEHKSGKLICHYCGYTIPVSHTCPVCGSKAIGGMKAGTEQIEALVKERFPDAEVLRMDMDTTSGKDGHTKILERFAAKKADILVGTQMIVKGHDYPNVGLVGIILADLSLNESDYRSAETTFQLVSQAVGRTGRGGTKGTAVIQTYEPDHYAIVKAMEQDYEGFYEEEMTFRSFLKYPPEGCMLMILGSCANETLLSKGMGYIRKYINAVDSKGEYIVTGPAPLPVRKVKDTYRQAVYIRHKNHADLESMAGKIDDYIEINPGFRNITIQYDYNE